MDTLLTDAGAPNTAYAIHRTLLVRPRLIAVVITVCPFRSPSCRCLLCSLLTPEHDMQVSRGFKAEPYSAVEDIYEPIASRPDVEDRSQSPAQESESYNKLHRAIGCGDNASVSSMLSQGFNPSSHDASRHSVRISAAKLSDVQSDASASIAAPACPCGEAQVKQRTRQVSRTGARTRPAPAHPTPPLMQLLHLACRLGLPSIVRTLLEYGAWGRVADKEGKTPLHDCAWFARDEVGSNEGKTHRWLPIARMLLDWDESLLRATDRLGHTPFDYLHASQWVLWGSMLQARADIWWHPQAAPGLSPQDWQVRLGLDARHGGSPSERAAQSHGTISTILKRAVCEWEKEGVGAGQLSTAGSSRASSASPPLNTPSGSPKASTDAHRASRAESAGSAGSAESLRGGAGAGGAGGHGMVRVVASQGGAQAGSSSGQGVREGGRSQRAAFMRSLTLRRTSGSASSAGEEAGEGGGATPASSEEGGEGRSCGKNRGREEHACMSARSSCEADVGMEGQTACSAAAPSTAAAEEEGGQAQAQGAGGGAGGGGCCNHPMAHVARSSKRGRSTALKR